MTNGGHVQRPTLRRPNRRAWAAALSVAVALVVAAPPPARAEQGGPAEAQQRFLRGVELFEAGEYSAALAEFSRAHELRPHFAILFNLAQCYVNIGRYAEAIDYFERYLSEGGRRIPRARRGEVEAELARLRPLIVQVTVTADVDGALIVVDGQEAGTSPLAAPLRVGAGLRVFEARLEGYRTARQELMIATGTTPPPVALHLEEIRRTAVLRVESPLPGATVVVDGVEQGRAPWEGTVDSGPHVVEARAERYTPARLELRLAPDDERTVTLTPELIGQPGRLQLEVDADEASVTIDGRDMGRSPLEPLELPAGVSRVRVESPGRIAWDGELTLREGQTTTARVDLASARDGVHQGWFWATLALAVAAGGAAAATGYFALAREQELDDYLDDVEAGAVTGSRNELEAQRLDLRDRTLEMALVTDVLLGVTGAAALSCLVLAFFTRFRPPESEVEVEIAGGPAQGGAWVGAAGRF
jgi:tetratricopeptide (TPR) repeat protein